MKSSKNNRIFSFIYSGQTIAAIEANSIDQARTRMRIIGHVVQVAEDCIVMPEVSGQNNAMCEVFNAQFLDIATMMGNAGEK